MLAILAVLFSLDKEEGGLVWGANLPRISFLHLCVVLSFVWNDFNATTVFPPIVWPMGLCRAREVANCFVWKSDFTDLRSSKVHPLNLSISISGGRETNRDSLSNGD